MLAATAGLRALGRPARETVIKTAACLVSDACDPSRPTGPPGSIRSTRNGALGSNGALRSNRGLDSNRVLDSNGAPDAFGAAGSPAARALHPRSIQPKSGRVLLERRALLEGNSNGKVTLPKNRDATPRNPVTWIPVPFPSTTVSSVPVYPYISPAFPSTSAPGNVLSSLYANPNVPGAYTTAANGAQQGLLLPWVENGVTTVNLSDPWLNHGTVATSCVTSCGVGVIFDPITQQWTMVHINLDSGTEHSQNYQAIMRGLANGRSWGLISRDTLPNADPNTEISIWVENAGTTGLGPEMYVQYTDIHGQLTTVLVWPPSPDAPISFVPTSPPGGITQPAEPEPPPQYSPVPGIAPRPIPVMPPGFGSAPAPCTIARSGGGYRVGFPHALGVFLTGWFVTRRWRRRAEKTSPRSKKMRVPSQAAAPADEGTAVVTRS